MKPTTSGSIAVKTGNGLEILPGIVCCELTEALHPVQVLHRDLKLENILLESGSPCLSGSYSFPQVSDDPAKFHASAELASDSHHPAYRAKICDFGLAVSLLDPNFDFRPNPMPSGLARTQTDDTFHDQMSASLSLLGSITLHISCS